MVPLVDFAGNKVFGTFVKRYKRFFVDVVSDDQLIVVHCPNSGSMKSCLKDHAPVMLTDHGLGTKRKLRYTLELIKLDDGWACLNTLRANQCVGRLLEKYFQRDSSAFNSLPNHDLALLEGDLESFDFYSCEKKFDVKNRIDFLIQNYTNEDKKWIEVKSVSLKMDSGVLAFPDAVTDRGTKHLETLSRALELGQKSMLWYVVMRSGLQLSQKDNPLFAVAKTIDCKYSSAFEKALQSGVEFRVLYCHVEPNSISLVRYKKFPDVGRSEVYA